VGFYGGAAAPCETLWNTIRETLHGGRGAPAARRMVFHSLSWGAAAACETLWDTIREMLHGGRRSACGAEGGVSFLFVGVARQPVKRCGTPFGDVSRRSGGTRARRSSFPPPGHAAPWPASPAGSACLDHVQQQCPARGEEPLYRIIILGRQCEPSRRRQIQPA
jgi:hypothetical protein